MLIILLIHTVNLILIHGFEHTNIDKEKTIPTVRSHRY
ncbi:hypothetical protein Clim_0489 [Chlorobium limicola DSM 245]|uniref:Uncharacterized protein n=1 Tax=Chlorobium limicola (strain DSM 245 / NBRC 103803 / 6330) TaxID=290315 RepID=B3EGE5_CHLL2|nr:hypothetical protein Clim_0489 [Chlorobium limicola DSM 245]